MLKVECEACKAPYQVDERRVPPTGLKMRCPKCGHSFVVYNPSAGPPPAAPPVPTAGSARPPLKQTMMGVGTPSQPAPLPIEDPFAGLAPPAPGPAPVGSGLPAALSSLDEIDLPAVPDEAGLPAVAQKKPPSPSVKPYAVMHPPSKQARPQPPSLQDFKIDLPSADLPSPKQGSRRPGALEVDLPSPAAGLPSPRPGPPRRPGEIADLPAVAAGLPAISAGLPAVAAGLPAPSAAGLPSPKRGGGGFGEIDLPQLASGLPAVPARDHNLPAVGGAGLPAVGGAGLPAIGGLPAVGGAGLPAVGGPGFPVVSAPGLPANMPLQSQLPSLSGPGPNLPMPTAADRHLPAPISDGRHLPAAIGEADFGELDLSAGVKSGPSPAFKSLPPPVSHKGDSRGAGGVGYGEVDLGAAASDAPLAELGAVPSRPSGRIASEVALPTEKKKRRRAEAEEDAVPSRAPRVFLAVFALLVIGGVLLQLTPYGAFGYLAVSDLLHEGEYNRLADTSAADARQRLAVDVYDYALSALDQLSTAHQAKPRARALAAYAALAEYEAELRFGRDSSRGARAKVWLDEAKTASPNARFVGIALSARKAVDGDLPGARKELDAASKRDPGDPVQQDIAFVRGELELAAKDAVAATAAFAKALQLAPSARAHFGLARAYAMAGNMEKARTELGATLAASAGDAGALALRASLAWERDRNEAAAIQDLNEILTGKAKDRASPGDRARSFALKGWIDFTKGRMADARSEFDSAIKLDPNNVPALVGQGEVLYSDGRFTEALAHFDTAVQADPTSAQAIVSDAKAKIALERLADAKTQLTAARQVLPNEMHVAYWLGKAEEALGNKKAAEDAYLAAVGLSDPKADDAIQPYLALSELLAGEGRASEAQAKLDEAKAKLPDSATMQRAFGEVAAVQGLYDEAIAHYQAAVDKDAQDISSRFLLGVTFRRMQKVDQARAEFDQVYEADKDYPGLAMERGLLFEQSGHIDKALEEFKAALNKAPDDPDLQLRVGAALVGIGNADEAIAMLKKVLEKRPTSAEASHYLGRAYFQKGGMDIPQARRYLKRAVELDPNRPEYHLYLAWISNEASPPDLGTARVEVDKALSLDKLLADGYWQRGVLERKQGTVDDGIRDLKRALTLKPTRFEAHAALAECYEDKNDLKTAMSEWAKAIAGNDTYPEWRLRYGKLLFDKGNAGAAATHLAYAAGEAEKMDVSPGWMSDAEFAAAQALRKVGKKQDAIEHYRRFLDKAPQSSPDRRDALNALSALGAPYEQ